MSIRLYISLVEYCSEYFATFRQFQLQEFERILDAFGSRSICNTKEKDGASLSESLGMKTTVREKQIDNS